MTRNPRIFNGEKVVFSIISVGETRYLHTKGWDWTCILTPLTNINRKWIKALNTRPKTVRLREEDIEKKLLYIGLVHKVVNNAKTAINKGKNKYVQLLQTESFCTGKEKINKMKNQHIEWKKIFVILFVG